MTLNYKDIKTLAAEIGCNTSDLLALSPMNDPFYAAMPSRAQAGQWFAEVWERLDFAHGVVHLRRTHYVIVSQDPPLLKPDGKPYLNIINDWKFLGNASLAARYLGLIPPDAFVDRRNPEPMIFAPDASAGNRQHTWQAYAVGSAPQRADQVPEIYEPYFYVSGFDAFQPYHVEVVVEKSTVNDILEPLAKRYGFNLVTGIGEMSETAARQLVERVIDAGKPCHVAYLADCDPGGRSMPAAFARKIEWHLRDLPGVEITLNPLLLTPEQVLHYRLPRTPIKETEKRGARFEERFGEGAVELDALEALRPGEIKRLVEAEVCRYLDPTLSARVYKSKQEITRPLDATCESVLAPFAKRFAKVKKQYEEAAAAFSQLDESAERLWKEVKHKLADALPHGEQPGVPHARPINPVEAPLFDSERDPITQIDAYRAWQGRDGGGAE